MSNVTSKEYLGSEYPAPIDSTLDFSERVLSIGAGTYMIYKGVKDLFSSPLGALGQVAIGSALLYRGAAGTCSVKSVIDRVGNKISSYQDVEEDAYL